MERLPDKIPCPTCGVMATSFRHEGGVRPYRHKTGGGQWCKGYQMSVETGATGAGGTETSQGRAPRSTSGALPTLRDVMPAQLQAVVPQGLEERYLPLCWLCWEAGRGSARAAPPKTDADLARSDMYAQDGTTWSVPPGGVLDLSRFEDPTEKTENDADESPRTRPASRPAGVGESGYSLEVERELCAFAARNSKNPEMAAAIAQRELKRMRAGSRDVPGSAGKIILTAMLNAKILKSAGSDGFIEHKLGRVENLSDGEALSSAKAMNMDAEAAKLGIVGGEE